MGLNYLEAEKFVINSYGAGRKHGLDIVLDTLSALGTPQERLRVIHVAGTNGKGSVCAMVSNALTKAVYKTGFFSSPHLHSFRERFRIDGVYISEEDFADQVSKAKTAQEAAHVDGGLSYFELLTVMAYNYFCEKGVDYAVVEVGLGGRLDATNVITKPILSVITSISLDHTEYLGNTIEEVAAEKAGIIKKNCPVVLYSQEDAVYNIVEKAARDKEASLFCDKNAAVDITKETLGGISFSVKSDMLNYENVELSLFGRHQIKNASLALLVLRELRRIEGLALSDETILNALRETKWSGRLEIIADRPTIIVDGAHNMGAVSELILSLNKLFEERRMTLVIGILKDKPYDEMVNALCALSDNIVLTKPYYGARAASPAELYDCLARNGKRLAKNIIIENDCAKAVDTAVEINPENGIIVVCGSLYLVGDVRKHVLESRR